MANQRIRMTLGSGVGEWQDIRPMSPGDISMVTLTVINVNGDILFTVTAELEQLKIGSTKPWWKFWG